MLIGILGLIGSGKSTVSSILIKQHGFHEDSFAATLKDVVSLMYGWDRALLEGTTEESRLWRQRVDPWWEAKLEIEGFTPRMALQMVATDTVRDNFNKDMWLFILENRLRKQKVKDTVITDVRFENEAQFVLSQGGKLISVERGNNPEWVNVVSNYHTSNNKEREMIQKIMSSEYPNIHRSEWESVSIPVSHTINNNGTINDLHISVEIMINTIKTSS